MHLAFFSSLNENIILSLKGTKFQGMSLGRLVSISTSLLNVYEIHPPFSTSVQGRLVPRIHFPKA